MGMLTMIEACLSLTVDATMSTVILLNGGISALIRRVLKSAFQTCQSSV